MKTIDGLPKKRFLILLALLAASMILSLIIQKTDLIFKLLTAPMELENQIENQAVVTFEDAQGNQYGPVSSNEVVTSITPLPPEKCQDDTPINTCSNDKPKYCDSSGNLLNNYCYGPDKVAGNSDDCGCLNGEICQLDGSCAEVEIEPLKIKVKLEGKTDFTSTLILYVLTSGTENIVFQKEGGTDHNGKLQIETTLTVLPAGNYDFRIIVPYYLSKRVANITWPSEIEIEFDDILAGNLYDTDNIINSSDWAIISGKWGTADEVADINKDGKVNTLDWSLMNRNWGKTGN